jgi:hypothetical protein
LVFGQILGIPAHALLVHAAVVFIPLLVLIAITYAVLPRLRARVGWAAAVLAVVAPVAAFFAKESGDQLEAALIAKKYPPEILNQVAVHSGYGDVLLSYTLGLGVATVLLLFVTSGHRLVRGLPSWVGLVLGGIVVVLGVITAGYAYLTGDTGAHAVWQGVL